MVEAQAILRFHRASHQLPLTKAAMGLRSMIRTEHVRVEVAQRLKREVTIIDKLVRQATMALSKMHDIAGCSAILVSTDTLRRVEHRLRSTRPPIRTYDYIAEPRASGYRAVHVIVEYDDRPIEIQLRTRSMQVWADTVENLGPQVGFDLKSGRGPEAMLHYLRLLADLGALEEANQPIDAVLYAELERAKHSAFAVLPEDPHGR